MTVCASEVSRTEQTKRKKYSLMQNVKKLLQRKIKHTTERYKEE
jgi:hypothetical protein